MRRKKHRKACHYQTVNTIIIPVEIVKLENNSFHLLVRMEINGFQGDAILDTGASVTVIGKHILSEENKEENVHLQSGGISGQIGDVRAVKVQQIRIGSLEIRLPRVAVIDLTHINEMYDHHLQRKIIALLGCDFCVKYRVIIDYEKKILICRR